MSPRASIIVPVLRQRHDYLTKCLESAVQQTVPCETIVVTSDDTPEETLQLIELFASGHEMVRVLERLRPLFAAAINTGIEAAHAPRVGLLLSDDWLEKQAVERCLDRSADIISTDVALYDETGTKRLLFKKPRSMARYEQLSGLESRASFLGHFFMFQREALLRVGGVDETIGNVGPDDFDMIWSLLEAGATVDLVEEQLYCYRDHPGERLTLRPRADQVRDLEKILDKHNVHGPARAESIARHARWYGRTLQQVVSESE